MLFGALFAAGCGGGLVTPSTLAPIIVCPTPVTAQSLDGNPMAVTWEPPQIIAGEPPLRISCTPPSGTVFPLGASSVTCNVSDSVARTNACTFAVTVARPPALSVTSFMAFGNSITEGKTASGFTPSNYPENLRILLERRYATQKISIANRGLGGETAIQGAVRIHQELDDFNPQALLLEEGVNDLALGDDSTKVTNMINALRDIIREAKSRGIVVFLATITPARAGGTPPRGDAARPWIVEANARIRQLAFAEAVTLVDLYEGFGGRPDPYIDVDGLHPTEAGYRKIAELFFDAIRQRLETAQAPMFVELLGSAPGTGVFGRFR